MITGPPGAGKSTVSRALAGTFPFGMHIPIDDLREWVAGGMAHPLGWSDETTRQYELAEDAAAEIARRYRRAGFAVVLDHCTMPPRLEAWLARTEFGEPLRRVMLLPSLEATRGRNLARVVKDFDTAVLDPHIPNIHRAFAEMDAGGWEVIDTTEDTVERTVERIRALG
ncbi:MAG: ATP-binding protein [Fimbriimonadaceae bacterium]|nr:AAA family ATPase [Chthonomonadaceae bacterium]MCO5296058.1 ATP-binding protein [Fimbriimonadaceae bacterium]